MQYFSGFRVIAADTSLAWYGAAEHDMKQIEALVEMRPARVRSLDIARMQRLVGEGAWIVTGQVAAVLGSLAAVRVLTEYLTPAQYGELALGLTIAGLVNQVVMGGVGNGIGRFYSIAAEKGDLPGYLKASRRLLGYATLAVAAIASLLMLGLVWTDRTQWLGLAAAALIFALLAGYNSCLSGVQNAARQRQIVALHSALDSWLKIALAVGVMFWLGTSSTAVVIGYALSALIVTASQLVFLRRLASRHVRRAPGATTPAEWAGNMWRYGWPFSLWGVAAWLQSSSARWALETYEGLHHVGLFQVLMQFSYPIQLAIGFTLSFVSPILFQRVGNAVDRDRIKAVRSVTRNIAMMALVLTLFLALISALFHDIIFFFIVGSDYHTVSHYLWAVILGAGMLGTSQLISVYLLCALRSKDITIAGVWTGFFGVLLNYSGAAVWGLQGSVFAQLTYATANMAWLFLLVYSGNQKQ